MRIIKPRLKILYPTLLWIWISLIFIFSSQTYHEQSIQPFLSEQLPIETATKIVPDVTIHYGDGTIPAKESPYAFLEFVFRKSSHLFMYAVLGLLFCITLYNWIHKLFSSILISVYMTGIIALLDEYNQYFNPDRTGRVQDVLLDLVGASLGIILYLSYNIYRARRSRP